MKLFLLFTVVYPTHIRKNKDFPQQTLHQLLSVEANFEGWIRRNLKVSKKLLKIK